MAIIEDVAAEAKARRLRERVAPAPVTATYSSVTKAAQDLTHQRGEDLIPVAKTEMPWATTHDSSTAADANEVKPNASANIQGEQTPLKLSAAAKAALDLVGKMKAPPAPAKKDDDGGDSTEVEMAAKAALEASAKAWPQDLSAAFKGHPSRRDAAIAKAAEVAKEEESEKAKAQKGGLGDDVRAQTKEPEPTDRGKVEGGAVPVREVTKQDQALDMRGVAKAVGPSFDIVERAIRAALNLRYPPKPETGNMCGEGPWPREVYVDSVVYCYQDTLYSLPYVFDGKVAMLGENPVQVRVSYVPA